ncbi:MAG TPA: hypothetical protein VK158_01800 [Acidobacteriota bacterium]|nr:hypothetical protein [Acidobacteriota bacterium]
MLQKGDLLGETLYIGSKGQLLPYTAPRGGVVAFMPREYDLQIGKLKLLAKIPFNPEFGQQTFDYTEERAQRVGLVELVEISEIYGGTMYEPELEFIPPMYRCMYRVTRKGEGKLGVDKLRIPLGRRLIFGGFKIP